MAADKIVSFTVQRSTDNVIFNTIATLTAPVVGDECLIRSYDDATVPNPVLYYKLIGHTAQGVTIPYNVVSVMQNVGVPTGLNGTAPPCGPVQLTWNNNGAASYNIYRNGTKVFNSLTNSINDAGISASNSYVYTVSAIDGQGLESAQSSPFNITTPACSDLVNPAGSWTSPANGSTITGVVTFTLHCTDNISVGKVEVFIQNLGTYIPLTYYGNGTPVSDITFTFDTTQLTNDGHLFIARVHDIAGNISDNIANSYTVSNVNLNPGVVAYAHDIGGAPSGGECYAVGCASDSFGNVYVVGRYSGTIGFVGPNNTTINKTSNGGADIFLSKYDLNGNNLFLVTFGGQYDNVPSSIAIDPTGNIAITGYITGTMTVTGVSGPITITSGAGNNAPDMFVIKFNPNGAALWGKSGFSGLGLYGNSVVMDVAGNVFVGGQMIGIANFGVGNVNAYGSDGFAVCFASANGDYVWANVFGGTGYDVCSAVGIDSNGDVYVTGYTSQSPSLDFGGGPRPVQNAGPLTSAAFLAKYSNATGQHIWSRVLAGPNDPNNTTTAVMSAISFDPSSSAPNLRMMCSGTFTQSITIDGTTLSAPQSAGMIIGTFSAANGQFSKVISIGGVSSTGGTIGPRNMVCDSSGNVVITGIASGEVDWGNGQLTAGTGTIFLVKYKPDLGYIWAKRFAATGWSLGNGVSVDPNRNLFAVGGYAGDANFEQFAIHTANAQTKDGYLLKTGP